MRLPLLLILSLICNCIFAQRTDPKSQPGELGSIAWYRSYQEALDQAKKQNKSVLLLFQEVPGCSTCKNYGQNVLSHPIITEVIQNEFIPLVIYNNKSGTDAEVLKMYNEPSWNNPVVRIIDSEGKNIVERISGHYNKEILLIRMTTALQLTRTVPGYLELFNTEYLTDPSDIQTETYSMYCFWSGEATLGNVDGVIRTEPGFQNSREVVRVWYDSRYVKAHELNSVAKSNNYTPMASKSGFRTDNTPQYHLSKSNYKYLPLSHTQKSRINSALANGGNPSQFLSPTQNNYLDFIKQARNNKKLKVLYTEELENSWKYMLNKLYQ